MVGTGDAGDWQKRAREFAEAALHAIADHGVTDLLGHGVPDADRGIAVRAGADLENETGHGVALAAISGEEVGATRKGG